MEAVKKFKMSSVDLDTVAVLDKENIKELLKKFASKFSPDSSSGVEAYLTNLLREPLSSKETEEWLEWCNKSSKVKVTNFAIPWGVLPLGCSATLYDVKVGGFKGGHGPDDKIYNDDVEIRDRIARGNTVLKIHDSETNEEHFDFVTFALKKFTGGMGDEDEDQPDDEHVWQKYFIKPLEKVTKVVCMMKENGEAAHMSVTLVKGKFVLIAGSKNVHLAFRNKEDLEKYTDSRFLVAKNVATAVLEEVSSMTPDQLSFLLNLMQKCRLTACFEILVPSYQHVVDLTHLDRPKLKFITWTQQFGADNGGSYCAVAPHIALDLGKELGLAPVEYEVVAKEEVEDQMEKIRREHGYEGKVLYFMDEDMNAVGLLKKKTAWYVLCRAIREKVAHAYSAYKKDPVKYGKQTVKEKEGRIEKRLREIQKWLDLKDEETEAWIRRGVMFQDWVVKSSGCNPLIMNSGRIQGVFPQLWAQFLEEKQLGDKIKEGEGVADNGDALKRDFRSKKADILVWKAKEDSPFVLVDESADLVRPHIATCILRNVNLLGRNCHKVINAQNKLHAGPCKKRNLATIGLHDLSKIQSRTLRYTAMEPNLIMISPISDLSTQVMDLPADKLLEKLKAGQDKLGIYSHMLEGKSKYPFLMDDETTLSLPPLTNSNCTKLTEDTSNIFVEITSDTSQEAVERVMEMLLKQFLHLDIGTAVEGYQGKTLCAEKGKVIDAKGIEKFYPAFNQMYSVYEREHV